MYHAFFCVVAPSQWLGETNGPGTLHRSEIGSWPTCTSPGINLSWLNATMNIGRVYSNFENTISRRERLELVVQDYGGEEDTDAK